MNIVKNTLDNFRNNFYFISDDKLYTMLNFDFASYSFLDYDIVINSLDRTLPRVHDPVITSFYNFSFYEHIRKIYDRTLFGHKFSEQSYIYSFIFGFYLFILWKLGGGRRFLPLICKYSRCNYYGFYDLRYTPLALIFSTFPLVRWKMGYPASSSYNLQYFSYYNVNNIFSGPAFLDLRDQQLSEFFYHFSRKRIREVDNVFFFTFFLIIGRFFIFLPITLFHLFFRPVFFWTYFFFIRIFFLFPRYTGSLPFDYFCKRVYYSYFLGIRQLFVKDNADEEKNELEAEIQENVGSKPRKLPPATPYSDISLSGEQIFTRLHFRQAIRILSGYKPFYSSFFFGYYITSILARPSTQETCLRYFNKHNFKKFKFSVLAHALSIQSASVSKFSKGNPVLNRFNTVKLSRGDYDFFEFVHRFNGYVNLTLSLVQKKDPLATSTLFYYTLKKRSRFLKLASFCFSNILLDQIYGIFFIVWGILLFPFYFCLASVYGFPKDGSEEQSFSFAAILSRFLKPIRFLFLPFVFLIYLKNFLKLYFYAPIEYIFAVFRQFFILAKKSLFFNSYYNYYYFFRRYFFNFLFTKFFTREVEDEFDQIKDMADFNDDDDDVGENGPLDFEYRDYDIGFEKSENYDEIKNFLYDTYDDKSNSDFFASQDPFESDSRTSTGFFIDILFWSWFSVEYPAYSTFLTKDESTFQRFKSFDQSLETFDDSLFADKEDNNSDEDGAGFDDRIYVPHLSDRESDKIEDEDDYEEFYYDPEFEESFERYYDYLLSEKDLLELNNKLLSYRLKLDQWHSDVSKKLIAIPKEFLLMPANLRQPKTPDDWRLLTFIVSSLVLDDLQVYSFSARNDVEFIDKIWSKFSKIVKNSPEKIFSKLDSPDFEVRYAAIEQKFSPLFFRNGVIANCVIFIFGKTIFDYIKEKFNILRSNFRIDYSILAKGQFTSIDFSLLDLIYTSFVKRSSTDTSVFIDSLKVEFSAMSRLDVLSVIFYLRFLADSDFNAFYNFINTSPAGKFIWSKFENAFNLSVKYSPKSYDFVNLIQFYPEIEPTKFPINRDTFRNALPDELYNNLVGTSFEALFTYSFHTFRSFFGFRRYDGPENSRPIPEPGHPAHVFGAGYDNDELWNVEFELFTNGPSSIFNFSSIFFEKINDYFIDPSVAVTLFPFSYTYFLDDVYDVDINDATLDLDDQYIIQETEVGLGDSLSFYINEERINEDAEDELDALDPTDNEEVTGYMDDPDVFDGEDPDAAGDFPFYDGDTELWIDDSLEGGEDWEPEELDSINDVSISVNRLFFGTLATSSFEFPSVDPRVYTGVFSSAVKHSQTGYDLNYSANLKLAYNNRSEKSLVLSQNSILASLGKDKLSPLNVSFFVISTKFFFTHFLRFYFYLVALFFNITFYTYSSEISHLKNILIFKHFMKNTQGYRAPPSFVDKLKSWLYGFEEFYSKKEVFDRFKTNTFVYGDFYQGPLSKKYDSSFINFSHHIPFADFLFEEGRDAEYEITDFLVHSQQDYLDFDYLNYKDLLDIYDNSRFNFLDEYELLHLEDIDEAAPLSGSLNDEQDWDIGAGYSYSSDDFVDEIQMFNDRLSIFISALSGIFSLVQDYYFYFCKIKTTVYFTNIFYYWELRSNYEWSRLAATYGLGVYFVRYFFSFSIIFAIFLYSYFVFPRIFYWFFVHTLDYGLFLFFNAAFTFLVFFFASLLLFPHFFSFFSSFDKEERSSFYFLVLIIWVVYVFGGYARSPWYTTFLSREIFQNLGTEPDIFPDPLSRGYQADAINLNLESNSALTLYDLKGEREIAYNFDKFEGDYSRRLTSFNLYNKRPTLGLFVDSFKYNVLGIRNSHFTGYKYLDTRYDFSFSQKIAQTYHKFYHRNYLTPLGGLPKRYARLIRIHTGTQYLRIRSINFAYSYSVGLSNTTDGHQAIDPSNYLIDDPFYTILDPTPAYPYDFRPDSYYNVPKNDPHYSEFHVPSYGSSLKIWRFIKSYNFNYVIPRKKIIFYKGRNFVRRKFVPGNGRKRRFFNYIYRYGRVTRFKRFRPSSFTNAFSSPSANFYNTVSRHRYVQSQIKKGQFIFNYSNNFSKFILFYNFPKSKIYIDMFTFRPSQLYPRVRKRLTFDRYYSTVQNIRQQEVYMPYTLTEGTFKRVSDALANESFKHMSAHIARFTARYKNLARSKTFYRRKVSRMAHGSYYRKAYKPFFNFVRYSNFVHHYNRYITILHPKIYDNYYNALGSFTDKYLSKFRGQTNYKAYLSGLGNYQSKFKSSPLTQNKFARDPKRVIRKKFRRYKKDLFYYPAKRFRHLKTSADITFSNYSYKLKRYNRRGIRGRFRVTQDRNGRRHFFLSRRAKNYQLSKRRLRFYMKFYIFRNHYRKFFSNSRRYQTRKKRFFSRKLLKKRFFSKNSSAIRHKNIFNNFRVYSDIWLYGLQSFNRTTKSDSKAINEVRNHEKLFFTSVKKLGNLKPETAVSGRLNVDDYDLPLDFSLDYSTIRSPKFSYYKYSPINYAFNVRQFKLVSKSSKQPSSLFYFSSFGHETSFFKNLDVRRGIKAISAIEDLNRVRFFRPKRKSFKPYFYRYLQYSVNKKYRPRRFFAKLSKKIKKEFIFKHVALPVNLAKVYPKVSRKYSAHYWVTWEQDPNDPTKFKRVKFFNKFVRPEIPKDLAKRLKRERLYKKRYARLIYNRYQKAKPHVKRELRENGRRYKRDFGRYSISDFEAYAKKHRIYEQKRVFFLKNRFFKLPPKQNDTLAHAEVFILKEKRRRRAEMRRLAYKKEQLRLTAAKQKPRFVSDINAKGSKISKNSVSSADKSGSVGSTISEFFKKMFGNRQ